jgi:hypothetical protein
MKPPIVINELSRVMYRTFHQEGEEQNEEGEVEKGLTMEQQFLQLVLQNVRHFISLSGQPAWQLAALGKHSVGFIADPDPTLYLNANTDPGQTSPSLKVKFT